MLKTFAADVVYSSQPAADQDLDLFSGPIMENVFVSNRRTAVVLALIDFQSYLDAFVLYGLRLLFARFPFISILVP